MARADERLFVTGLVLMLLVAVPTPEELLAALESPDAPVRRGAQEALYRHCIHGGRGTLAWLKSIEVREPETRRLVRGLVARVQLYFHHELLEPFRRAGLDASDWEFVRYDTGRCAPGTTECVWSWGWKSKDRLLLDCTLLMVQADRPHQPADFAAFCESWLAGRVKLVRRVDPAFFGLLLSHWCYLRGKSRLAERLRNHATGGGDGPAFRRRVYRQLGRHLADRAVFAAFFGAKRVDVLSYWKHAFDIDPSWKAAYLGTYLLVQQPPDPVPTAERMQPRRYARYLISKLRDSRASRYSSRGRIRLRPPGSGLVDLGWAAIPALIPMLQDMRPTRGTWRVGDHYRPMTHGTLCREILERITGMRFGTTRAALVWWRGVRINGAEAFYARRLDDWDPLAARALMRTASIRYRDRVLSAARVKPEMLFELHGHLDLEHRGRLLPFLKSDNWRTVLTAAMLLREACGDDLGMRQVAALVSRPRPDFWLVRHAAGPLARMKKPYAGAALARLIRLGELDIRQLVIRQVALSRDPRVYAALIEALDDSRWTGNSRAKLGSLRICDLAAETLMKMHKRQGFQLSRPLVIRDSQIRGLKKWLSKK